MHAHFNTFLFYKMASGLDCSDSQSDVSSIRNISDVWKYFTKTPDKKKTICSICHKELAYSGGTTNLRDYMSSKYPLQYFPASEIPTGSKPTTLDGFVRVSKCSEARAKSITEWVSQMIVQELRSIRLVEGSKLRLLTIPKLWRIKYTLHSSRNVYMHVCVHS